MVRDGLAIISHVFLITHPVFTEQSAIIIIRPCESFGLVVFVVIWGWSDKGKGNCDYFGTLWWKLSNINIYQACRAEILVII